MARKSNSYHGRRRASGPTLHLKVWNMRIFWNAMLRLAWRGTLVLMALAALGGLYIGGRVALDRLLFSNPEYRLREVRLNANDALNERDLVAVAGIDLNENIFRFDLKEIARKVETLPAVQSATVDRRTPGTLVVNVAARSPRAWLACPDAGLPAERRAGGLLLAFDGTAYPCPPLQLAKAATLPVVMLSKCPEAVLESGKTVVHPELANCLHLLNTARDDAAQGVDWIDSIRQTRPWSLLLTTRDGVAATFGQGDHKRQLDYLHTALAHASRKGYGIETINLIPRVNVPVTVSHDTVSRPVPVDAADEQPAPPSPGRRRARDLDSLIHRN